MEYLVVGSKGFIGSHLLADLRANNISAAGCDVIADYTDTNYFQFDTAENGFEEIFRRHHFDVCINCSGSASVPFSFEKPASDFQLNAVNVFSLLDAIRKYNPSCRFIQLSSAAVYGNPVRLPVTVNDQTVPVSVYGHHKLIAENICREFHSIFNTRVLIVRIFSAFGQGLRKQLFWDLYQKALGNNSIELFGTGEESRDFIHVLDVVAALKLLASGGDFNCSVYNIASGKQINIRYAAECFMQGFNPEIKVSFTGKKRSGDPDNWEADISGLLNLGFNNKISFEDGISQYIEWLKGKK